METPPESEIPVAPVKKKLSERRLESLARARERASQVAKERRESKIRAKAAELDTTESTPDFSDDPIVVVEQSESDEEKLEGLIDKAAGVAPEFDGELSQLTDDFNR